MITCKSPTHKKYADALEDLDISAGLIIKELTEARQGDPDDTARQVRIYSTMQSQQERIEWALSRLAKATVAVNAHIDSRCRLVR